MSLHNKNRGNPSKVTLTSNSVILQIVVILIRAKTIYYDGKTKTKLLLTRDTIMQHCNNNNRIKMSPADKRVEPQVRCLTAK